MEIGELIDKDFSGVIAVRKRGGNILWQASGFADLANEVPNTVETKFPTASAGKIFVAVAILQLIEQKKLSLDSRLSDLVTFNPEELDPAVTIEQLLTHTSGVPDYFDESVMTDYSELWRDFPNYKIRTSKDLLPLFIHKPMMYPPGQKFQYNNSGYVLLGLILEAFTGVPFDTCLNTSIFQPCGMANTGYFELDRLPAQCANAYIYDEARQAYHTNIFSVDAKGTGAGGAYTTVGDIERFWDSLLGAKLVSKSTLNAMLSPQVKERCYGYGVWLDEQPTGGFVYHIEGCDPGVSFWSSYDPEKELNITLVSNFGHDVWRLEAALETLSL